MKLGNMNLRFENTVMSNDGIDLIIVLTIHPMDNDFIVSIEYEVHNKEGEIEEASNFLYAFLKYIKELKENEEME